MSPSGIRILLNSAAIGSMAIAASGAARAADVPFVPIEQQAAPAKIELIENSRLGCVPTIAAAATTASIQCAFDEATRGAQIAAKQDWDKGSIEAYATVAHATAGALTPDRLLVSRQYRSTESTDFVLAGLKGSAFDGRLKFTTEVASTKRVVDDLIRRDWLADDTDSGTSAMARVEAKLVSKPRFKWSVTAEMRSTSDDYAVGGFETLARYAVMPGTRLAISSKALVGQLVLSAGLEQLRTPYGQSASRKAGLDFHGVSLRVVSRDSSAEPFEGSTLIDSSTRTTSAYVDLDSNMMATSLLPEVGDLPFLVPSMVSFSYRSGETENRFTTFDERFGRSSLGIDGTWETPIGETILSYWHDSRTGLTTGAQSRSSETMQASHFIRYGNWRFGLDASLTRGTGDGSSGYGERSWSFGQSVSYTRPNGPEFRLSLGQDRDLLRMSDASFASSDSYSRITASLDLSRYLQKRFERSDLHLTLDYRKSLSRSDMEMNLFDEMVERWVEGDRREGFLMSFGMKL